MSIAFSTFILYLSFVISMNLSLFSLRQFSSFMSFIISMLKVSETAVGWLLMDPLAMRSRNSWNSSTGTRFKPFGSSALSQRFSKSPSMIVNISKKHLRFKNWSHSILTFSLLVSIPSAEISLLLTSLNLSARDMVNSKKTLSGIDGPSLSIPIFFFPPPSAPSSGSSSGFPYSKVSPLFLFLALSFSFFASSFSIVIKLQNSASSWKTCYQVMWYLATHCLISSWVRELSSS